MKHEQTIYGLMAEFATPEQLLEAAHHTHDAGYRRIDAFAPFPIEGLAHAVGFHRTRLPLVVLLGRHSWRIVWILHAVLRRGDQLSPECWRQAAE